MHKRKMGSHLIFTFLIMRKGSACPVTFLVLLSLIFFFNFYFLVNQLSVALAHFFFFFLIL